MSNTIENSPEPFVLMDSMRSIGYSFEAAICDVIDNSVSANASKVSVFCANNSDFLYVEIIDDGCGMDYGELLQAMKYGKNRNLPRSPKDLGRFGLGLKSASLSQCKVLTVVSKKDGSIIGMRWDEDYVKQVNAWMVLTLSQEEIEALPNIQTLDSLSSGTLVMWSNFDVLQKKEGIGIFNAFCKEMDTAERQIRLVYHRFMDRKYSAPADKIQFTINNRPLTPFDPFLISKAQTSMENGAIMNEEDTTGVTQKIICTPYILPFQKDLTDDDKELIGGIENMARMQGFYIYRNFRLIAYGSWFGMRPASEVAKYARVMVDIPSSLDDKWGIDVKKEKASIPQDVKKRLSTIVESAFESSHKRIYKRTGVEKDDKKSLWTISHDRENRKVFTVNKESPLISSFKKALSNDQVESLDFILDSLSATLSYIDIYDAYAQSKEPNNFEILDCEDELEQGVCLFQSVFEKIQDVDLSIQYVCSCQPFASILGFSEKLKKEVKKKNE